MAAHHYQKLHIFIDEEPIKVTPHQKVFQIRANRIPVGTVTQHFEEGWSSEGKDAEIVMTWVSVAIFKIPEKWFPGGTGWLSMRADLPWMRYVKEKVNLVENDLNNALKPGKLVAKLTGDYTFEGVILSTFFKTSGEIRHIVQETKHGLGMLHVFSPSQLTEMEDDE